MKVRVTNIQRFSLHDGPGIRTTIFLKGCSIHCPWCANPENLVYEIQGEFGYDIELEDLEKEIKKDKKFYKLNQGGVTFSGGEPLLQFKELEPLLKSLKKEKINICVETSLYVPTSLLDIAIEYVDEFIVDVKILDKEDVSNILGGEIELYEKNIEKLFKKIPKEKIKLRIPVTIEYTLKENNKKKIIDLVKKYQPTKVELFKLHRLAEKKYEILKKDMFSFEEVKENEIQQFLEQIRKCGIDAEICKI